MTSAHMPKTYYVYILASRRNGTLYTGVTTDLVRRIWQHREGETPGFTSRYGVKRLVWYEEYGEIASAIARECCGGTTLSASPCMSRSGAASGPTLCAGERAEYRHAHAERVSACACAIVRHAPFGTTI